MRLTWFNGDTGEVKERSLSGVDRGWRTDHDTDGSPLAGDFYEDEWEISPLELALGLVPDLVAVITVARSKGHDVTVRAASVQ